MSYLFGWGVALRVWLAVLILGDLVEVCVGMKCFVFGWFTTFCGLRLFVCFGEFTCEYNWLL